jgi:hypothetical protein
VLATPRATLRRCLATLRAPCRTGWSRRAAGRRRRGPARSSCAAGSGFTIFGQRDPESRPAGWVPGSGGHGSGGGKVPRSCPTTRTGRTPTDASGELRQRAAALPGRSGHPVLGAVRHRARGHAGTAPAQGHHPGRSRSAGRRRLPRARISSASAVAISSRPQQAPSHARQDGGGIHTRHVRTRMSEIPPDFYSRFGWHGGWRCGSGGWASPSCPACSDG